MNFVFRAPLFFIIHRMVPKNTKKGFEKRNDVPERNLIESQSFLHRGIERSRDN